MVETRMDESHQSHERKASWMLVDDTKEGGRFDPFSDSKHIVLEEKGPDIPSTGSLSSLSHEHDTAASNSKRVYPHVRTNFKSQSYMPPPVTRRAAWDDEEMPFDQMGQSRPVPHHAIPPIYHQQMGDRPFDEAPDDELMIVGPGSPEKNSMAHPDNDTGGIKNIQVLRAYYSDADRLQANVISSPRGSNPPKEQRPLSPEYSEATRVHSNSLTNDDATRNGIEFHFLDQQKEKYEEFGLSPGSGTDSPTGPREAPILEEQGHTDDDSLFDFEADRKRKKLAAVRDRRERRARRNRVDVDDNSSIEPDQGVSLQARAQHAFLTRNRKLPKTAVTKMVEPSTSENTAPKQDASSPSVSFDNNLDTVHHYATEEEDDDDDDGTLDETIISVEEQSVFSEYTKSMESEVEDIFKDLFFIGSGTKSKPGRRAKKDKPAKKRGLEQSKATKEDDDSWMHDEGSALETLGEDSILDDTYFTAGQSTLNGEEVTLDSRSETSRSWSASPTKVSVMSTRETKSVMAEDSSSVASADIPDPLTAMWEFMEGGVSAVGAALGIAPTQCSPTKGEINEEEQYTLAIYSTKRNDSAIKSMKRSISNTRPKIEIPPSRQHASYNLGGRGSQIQSAFDFASDLLLGPNGELTDHETENQSAVIKSPLDSLENDPRLAELALYTARSVHEIQGLVLDERDTVELVTQVEFHVVKMGLPLGILFQENGGGCWVAKVFSDGNAAKKAQGTGVKVGDQLAAIDGRSSIKMKVDNICSLISEAENTQSIELTFLRYSGPLRPTAKPCEGYEIADTSGTDVYDTDEQRTDRSSTESHQRGTFPSPSNEHAFDTMHKSLRLSRSGDRSTTSSNKSKKIFKTKESKKRFRLFGRKAKTAEL